MKLRCVKVESLELYPDKWRSTLQGPNTTIVIVTEHPEYEPNQLYEVSIRKVNEQ